jgi:hypothetical protein
MPPKHRPGNLKQKNKKFKGDKKKAVRRSSKTLQVSPPEH